ncbi:MAG: hypothetical protein HOP10_12555 [Chitinophagaceae bacterium]|nr:hypothetical protein [Chitinophagaceae bacterium]
MKKIFIPLICLSFVIACGKTKSPKEIAQDICDCSKKANALPVSDPNRSNAQQECQKKNVEAWNKVKGDIEKAAAFNEVLSACATEQIRKSFGQ